MEEHSYYFFFLLFSKRNDVKSTEYVKKNHRLSLTFSFFSVYEKFITVEFSIHYQMIVNYNCLPIT